MKKYDMAVANMVNAANTSAGIFTSQDNSHLLYQSKAHKMRKKIVQKQWKSQRKKTN